MTTNQKSTPINDQEIASIRHNVNLLRSQIQAGRVDGDFLARQVDSLVDFLGRADEERKQRKKEGRFQALYTVSRLLGSSLDLQTVLDQVMDAILHLTAAERGFLMLRDDDGGLGVKAARGLDQKTLSSDNFKYSRTIANQVLDGGTAILTTNATEDPRFAGQASIVGQSLRSIMATPLRARGTVIGVVYVDNRMMAGLFNDDDLAALDTFAGQAAVALDNARLFSATDELLSDRVEELQRLRRIDHQLSESLDAHKAMQITLEWACRLSNATSGYLGLIEEDSSQIRVAVRFGAGADQPEQVGSGYEQEAQVIASGETVILNPEQGNGRAVALLPIRRDSAAFGLVVIEREGEMPFTADEQDVIERTISRAAVAIENARLYAAVRAADKAKSEFVGTVAHDLKVPMTSISGYSDLLMMTEGLNEQQVGFLKRIKDTVKRMSVLVSDLADISRIESGYFYMNETRVPVTDIVEAVRDGSMTQIQEYRHTYLEEIDSELPDLHVDYYRLVQVLTNLVSNAYKYTPEGGTITFHVGRDNDRIRFTITDTGVGLSPEAVAKLGTKFWRAEDEFTRSRPGTGLGFAITRSLVEQMGGHIQIESQLGKGSTFLFSVPVEQD